ncbi:hypothetical protein Tco_1530146 [Tanacetum coccineum]
MMSRLSLKNDMPLRDKYLKGTHSLGLWCPKYSDFDLKGYSDSDYARCKDMKNTSAEVKYVAAAGCCANILWMKSQLTDYDIIYEKALIFCDNTSAIAISNNPVLHSRKKHIDIKYHFFRDHILKGDIELHFIPTQYQLVDIFTKPLAELTFKRLICELGGILGEARVNTFRNAIGAHYLSHSSEYVIPPSIKTIRWRLLMAQIIYCLGGKTRGFDQITNKDAIILSSLANGVNIDYAKLIWEDIITKLNKKTREKVVPYTRFSSLLLEHKMKDVLVEHKAPNTSSYTRKKDSKGKKLGAKSRHRKQPTSSKHQPLSKIEATKGGSSKAPTGSKTVHLVKETLSISVLDINQSQPPAFTLVVVGLHKEDQQATGGPTSLGVTISTIIHSESASEHDFILFALKDSISQTIGDDEGPNKLSPDHLFVGTNPHVLVETTKSASEGLETILTQPTTGKGASDIAKKIKEEFNTSHDLSSSEDTQKKIKLEREEEAEEIHATNHTETEDTSAPQPSSSSSLPTKLKELPSNLNELTSEVKELKKHVHELEIELPWDLKEIPNKLEVKLKTLDALPSLLNKVTEALDKFAQVIYSESQMIGDTSVPSAVQAGTQPTKGEKNTNQVTISYPPKSSSKPKGEHIKKDTCKKATSSKDVKEDGSESDFDNTIHLTSSMVESLKKKKLKKFDFVTEGGDHVHLTKEQIKEQKRIEESAKAKAAKHEVEVRKEELVDLLGLDMTSKKGLITPKVYREDGTSEVILNFKASDLHLAEQGIELDKPLSEQDPLNKPNNLAKKKRKNADDIHDYFRANKKLKSSVQYKDHPAGTRGVIKPSQARAQQGLSSARKTKGWLEHGSIARQALTIKT